MELNELEKKYKEMGEEIERLKADKDKDKPKVGDFCRFWDEGKEKMIYGYLQDVDTTLPYPYNCENGNVYENCEKAHFTPNDISFVEAMRNPDKYEVTWGLKNEWVELSNFMYQAHLKGSANIDIRPIN